jgi:hypothetical protein
MFLYKLSGLGTRNKVAGYKQVQRELNGYGQSIVVFLSTNRPGSCSPYTDESDGGNADGNSNHTITDFTCD